MDRRLPRDEDGLASDRRLTMAVGTGGGASGGDRTRSTRPMAARSSGASSSTPRRAWCGRRSTTRALTARPLPGAQARTGRPGVAGRRDHALGSGAARPAARRRPCREPRGAARGALPRPGDRVGLRQRVELAARAGRRAGRGSSTPPPSSRSIAGPGILVRLGRASLASRVESHLRALKERSEAAQRTTNPVT